MKKSELADALAAKCGLSKGDANAAISAIGEVVSDQLHNGGEVVIPGIGKFAVAHRSARMVRNPRTGESSMAPAHNAPVFRFSAPLKASLKS